MTPEDIKAFKLKMEYYQKAIEEALAYSKLLMDELEKLGIKDNDRV